MWAFKHGLIDIRVLKILIPNRQNLLSPRKPVHSLIIDIWHGYLFVFILNNNHMLCDELNLRKLRVVLIYQIGHFLFLTFLPFRSLLPPIFGVLSW